MGVMNIGGLASGLKTDEILAQLEQIARAPITRLQAQQSQLTALETAWNEMNTGMLAIQQKAETLSKLNEKITMSATSSDAAVAVSADRTTAAGTYAFTVESVATYHQLTSQGYTDKDITPLGAGTFTVTAGTKSAAIDTTGMTLAGLRDAINTADAGVNAFIVSDGAAYRLVLTAKELGNAGKITVNSTIAGGAAPAMVELQAAKDTKLTFGSGSNAFSITRASLSLTDVIPGVTLNIGRDAQGKAVNVNVTQSTAGVKSAIQDLVSGYNELIDYVSKQTQYDSKTGVTGVLFGESRVKQIVNDMYSLFTTPLQNLGSSSITSLAQMGITTNSEGKLSIKTADLDKAIADHLPDVLKLFQNSGSASDAAVSFVNAGRDTLASPTGGYAVQITQAATRAHLTFDTAGDGLPAALGGDETVTINGTAITLTAGMTAEQIVTALNAKAETTQVVASLTGADGTGSGNYLTLTQRNYGADYNIHAGASLVAGDTNTGIGVLPLSQHNPGVGNSGAAGLDVAGTLNGKAATGKGQTLTGTEGDSKGLIVSVSATTAGAYGTVTVAKGIGSRIERNLSFVTDAASGMIATLQKNLTTRQTALQEEISRADASATREIQRMQNQFNAMEVALSRLQNQGNQLAGLIAGLPKYSSD